MVGSSVRRSLTSWIASYSIDLASLHWAVQVSQTILIHSPLQFRLRVSTPKALLAPIDPSGKGETDNSAQEGTFRLTSAIRTVPARTTTSHKTATFQASWAVDRPSPGC